MLKIFASYMHRYNLKFLSLNMCVLNFMDFVDAAITIAIYS